MLLKNVLNAIGGIPDIILRNIPDVTRAANKTGYDEYLSRLDFYSPSNWADKSFLYIPESVPQFEESTKSRISPIGAIKILRYPSRYEVRNPVMAANFSKYKANLSGYLYIWQHDRAGGRPFVLCLHGLMMGLPKLAVRMFKFSKLFEMGMDVGLFVQPHHWKRQDRPPLQRLLNPEDAPLTIETFGQNIHDLHSAVLLIKSLGYDRVGIIGASLGGCAAALYATFDAPVDFMFIVVPAVNFDYYLDPRKAKFAFRVDSEVVSKTFDALKLISPLNYMPIFDVNKISTVIHAGDRLAEVKTTREWIKKWSIPNHVEVTGGHWFYFDRDARGKTWYGWLKKMGYTDRY